MTEEFYKDYCKMREHNFKALQEAEKLRTKTDEIIREKIKEELFKYNVKPEYIPYLQVELSDSVFIRSDNIGQFLVYQEEDHSPIPFKAGIQLYLKRPINKIYLQEEEITENDR